MAATRELTNISYAEIISWFSDPVKMGERVPGCQAVFAALHENNFHEGRKALQILIKEVSGPSKALLHLFHGFLFLKEAENKSNKTPYLKKAIEEIKLAYPELTEQAIAALGQLKVLVRAENNHLFLLEYLTLQADWVKSLENERELFEFSIDEKDERKEVKIDRDKAKQRYLSILKSTAKATSPSTTPTVRLKCFQIAAEMGDIEAKYECLIVIRDSKERVENLFSFIKEVKSHDFLTTVLCRLISVEIKKNKNSQERIKQLFRFINEATSSPYLLTLAFNELVADWGTVVEGDDLENVLAEGFAKLLEGFNTEFCPTFWLSSEVKAADDQKQLKQSLVDLCQRERGERIIAKLLPDKIRLDDLPERYRKPVLNVYRDSVRGKETPNIRLFLARNYGRVEDYKACHEECLSVFTQAKESPQAVAVFDLLNQQRTTSADLLMMNYIQDIFSEFKDEALSPCQTHVLLKIRSWIVPNGFRMNFVSLVPEPYRTWLNAVDELNTILRSTTGSISHNSAFADRLKNNFETAEKRIPKVKKMIEVILQDAKFYLNCHKRNSSLTIPWSELSILGVGVNAYHLDASLKPAVKSLFSSLIRMAQEYLSFYPHATEGDKKHCLGYAVLCLLFLEQPPIDLWSLSREDRHALNEVFSTLCQHKRELAQYCEQNFSGAWYTFSRLGKLCEATSNLEAAVEFYSYAAGDDAVEPLTKIANRYLPVEYKEDKQEQKITQTCITSLISYYDKEVRKNGPFSPMHRFVTRDMWHRRNTVMQGGCYWQSDFKAMLERRKSVIEGNETLACWGTFSDHYVSLADALLRDAYYLIAHGKLLEGLQRYQQAFNLCANKFNLPFVDEITIFFPDIIQRVLSQPEAQRKDLFIQLLAVARCEKDASLESQCIGYLFSIVPAKVAVATPSVTATTTTTATTSATSLVTTTTPSYSTTVPTTTIVTVSNKKITKNELKSSAKKPISNLLERSLRDAKAEFTASEKTGLLHNPNMSSPVLLAYLNNDVTRLKILLMSQESSPEKVLAAYFLARIHERQLAMPLGWWENLTMSDKDKNSRRELLLAEIAQCKRVIALETQGEKKRQKIADAWGVSEYVLWTYCVDPARCWLKKNDRQYKETEEKRESKQLEEFTTKQAKVVTPSAPPLDVSSSVSSTGIVLVSTSSVSSQTVTTTTSTPVSLPEPSAPPPPPVVVATAVSSVSSSVSSQAVTMTTPPGGLSVVSTDEAKREEIAVKNMLDDLPAAPTRDLSLRSIIVESSAKANAPAKRVALANTA